MAIDAQRDGTAGASALQEGNRRREAREGRVRAKHPRLGGLLLTLGEPPQHERAWARGAQGERMVAEALARRCDERVAVLHDRRVPRSKANIDHIAIAPSGVWVIDTKRYKGKVEVRKPWFGEPELVIAGRRKTMLVEGLDKQVSLVREVVPEPLVRGCFCFVESELPLFGTPEISGHLMLRRKTLAKRLNADGPLTEDDVALLTERLAAAFPPA